GYTFGEKLGAGSYGTVYKARLTPIAQTRPSSAISTRPIFYAIKCISRKALTKTTPDILINEIKLLKHIKHDNIVEMYDFSVNGILVFFEILLIRSFFLKVG
ncbi:unnamed protein product, partial [Adineta steineri]